MPYKRCILPLLPFKFRSGEPEPEPEQDGKMALEQYTQYTNMK